MRDPKTGHISKDFQQYNDQIARLRQAVPKMILQMGGSISFAPAPGEEAHAANYDTRHKLCTIKPTPDQITVMCGSTLYDQTAIHPLDTFEGTRFTDPAMAHAMANLVMDATPDFYLENIKRCVENGIQPYFALAHVHGLELVERLIRRGYYMGPVNGFFSTGAGGVCGVNPFDLMELVRRTPHGSCFTYQSTFRLTYPISMMMIALGQHTRAGIEENLWDTQEGCSRDDASDDRETGRHGETDWPFDCHAGAGATDAEDRCDLQNHGGNPRQYRPAAEPREGEHGLPGA